MRETDIPQRSSSQGSAATLKKEQTTEEKVTEAFQQVKADKNGLSSDEALKRASEFGLNQLPIKKENSALKFLRFLWNPLSWAMEVAAVLSVILLDWVDFGLIVALLLLNASIGYWEEHSSANAISALKNQLTPICKCVRDGNVNRELKSADLVPGDVILLRLGDVVPADATLFEGDFLKIDQSALTGESLPVTKFKGDGVYSGSIVKQGEMRAVVTKTGINTFFGRAANLMGMARPLGHFHTVLTSIGWFCISFIVVGATAVLLVTFVAYDFECSGISSCFPMENVLVLIVGGIPIAMPTVLSVTMALGARDLAKQQAIVSRLTAVEELAGMQILCSDKTGTLTKNKLTLGEPIVYESIPSHKVVLFAAYASDQNSGDAIDLAVIDRLSEEEKNARKEVKVLEYKPFDPVSKKTEALVEVHGHQFKVSKGAPQILIRQSNASSEIKKRAMDDVMALAKSGYRSLAVTYTETRQDSNWHLLGLIPMFDPPRDDTAETLRKTTALGVHVKMITGDQLAIARETARLLNMGDKIEPADALMRKSMEESRLRSIDIRRSLDASAERKTVDKIILDADGFAQVYPEHKYEIVKRLQEQNYVVGMTGDGVNDAPALKKANVGIAVADATDAARAAADIVLLTPGLSVIITAIEGSRKIFQRMKNYSMYSITASVRTVLTFGTLAIAFGFLYPTLPIVILAILNDGTMLTISRDRVKPSPVPDKWDLKEIFGISIIFGVWLTASTITLFVITRYTLFFQSAFGLETLTDAEIRSFLYLQVSLNGLATIFVTRSQGFSYFERPAWAVIGAFIFAQAGGTFIGAYGLNCYPFNGVTDICGAGWGYVWVAWLWALLWYIPMDFIKIISRNFFKGTLVHPKAATYRPYYGEPSKFRWFHRIFGAYTFPVPPISTKGKPAEISIP